MAEFKKLSAVETVESVSDAATVLIEENGVIKKAPKDEIGTNMKKLSAVETVESVSESANVLIEENGVIKKAPKTIVGGSGSGGEIGGLPYHVRVRYDVNTKAYSCDLDYYDIYELMKTGVFLYATIEENYSEEYKISPSRGYYYCSHSWMPDSDVIGFFKLEGNSKIIFYDSGSVGVSY